LVDGYDFWVMDYFRKDRLGGGDKVLELALMLELQ
jgi:hypothetical protein